MKDIVKLEARTEQYLVQYDKAVTALQAAKDALSLDGLQVVDITIEALRARGKITQDESAKQAAHELEVEKYRTAAIIAQAIVDRDHPTVKLGRHRADVPLGIQGVLVRAGWNKNRASAAVLVGRGKNPEIVKIRKLRKPLDRHNPELRKVMGRGSSPGRVVSRSDVWNRLYSGHAVDGVKLCLTAAGMQRNKAKNLAEEFEDRDEIILARRSVTQVRDWCDEFLKHLPKVRA